jgi:hypothetical protein
MTEDNNKTSLHTNPSQWISKFTIGFKVSEICTILATIFMVIIVAVGSYIVASSIARSNTTDKYYMFVVTNDKQIIQIPRETSQWYQDKFYHSFKNAVLVYYMGENIYCYYNNDNYTEKDQRTKDHDITHEYNCIVSHTL